MNPSALDSAGRPARARLFSLHGRLGRARYTTYTLGALVGAFALMYAAGRGLPLAGRLGAMLYMVLSIVLYYALLPATFAMLTVRRAHDFNCGGWIALLLLAPFVNLLFWFIPGTRGANRYGAAPPQEPMALTLGAIVLPLLLAAAFVATAPVQPPPAPPPVPSTSLKPYTP